MGVYQLVMAKKERENLINFKKEFFNVPEVGVCL